MKKIPYFVAIEIILKLGYMREPLTKTQLHYMVKVGYDSIVKNMKMLEKNNYVKRAEKHGTEKPYILTEKGQKEFNLFARGSYIKDIINGKIRMR